MGRIVVVDDSALVRRMVSEALTSGGHEVVAVGSGEEAVERTLSEAFDLVVSDVRMGAMTGAQLCRVLRSDPITRSMPIILLTASDDTRSRFWGRHAGADAYLAKEGAFESLLPTVEALLAARVPSGAETMRRPTHVDAAARVSAVLDRHLFDAVIASEARSLLSYSDDRTTFLDAAASLIREVIGTPVASLSVFGLSTTHALVVRRPFVPDELAIETLQLEPTTTPPRVFREGAFDVTDAFAAGVTASFELTTKTDRLGELRLFGGDERIGTDDLSTARLLAESLAAVVHSLLLVEETRRLAQTDALTGLANRRVLVERLELEECRSRRYGGDLSVLMVDVDHFKSVNDRFGHGVGDEVLRAVAQVVHDSVRNVDLAGRWGGEEFLVVLPACDTEGARVVAERVRAAIAALSPFASGPESVTVSCGVAMRTATTAGVNELVDAADGALYRAKKEGRDRVVIAES